MEKCRPCKLVPLLGLDFHCLDRHQVVGLVEQALARGEGGWILTPNVELVQQAAEDPEIRRLYARANLRVVDGIPLLWLARLMGRRLPDRVAGSDLVDLLAASLARSGHRLFLLGGDHGVAERAGRVLEERHPGLVVAGHDAPRLGCPPTASEREAVARRLSESRPDLVFVALGSPKTEYLIDALRPAFPAVWWLGCGISLSFVTGAVRRAPRWMQRSGLEWLHRLWQEPRRLAGRYLGRNLRFVLRGLGHALRVRLGGSDP